MFEDKSFITMDQHDTFMEINIKTQSITIVYDQEP